MSNKISIQEWLLQATAILKEAGVPSARLDSELLLADALGKDRTWLIAHSTDTINADTGKNELERRAKREPLAYIRGWQEFYGRKFSVTHDTLIPRPESEELIHQLESIASASPTILDIGTGSGCLGITAALTIPNSTVLLVDISTAALRVANENSERYQHDLQKLHSHITLKQSDLLADISIPPDIIIANLPYVDTDWETSPETAYEPSLALFASKKGLELVYRLICQAEAVLHSGSHLLLEADIRQMKDIEAYATTHHFTVIAQKDYTISLRKN